MHGSFLRWLLVTLVVLALLSVLALWAWGQFARSARGPATTALPAAPDATGLDRMVQPLLDAHGAGESAAALVDDPLDAFIARAHMARAAERSLDVQYYIWQQDLTGHLLERELIQAADRGVRVRLLLDDVNAAGKDEALQALASHPAIEVRLFNPARNRAKGLRRAIEMGLRFVGFNRRMHNKAWIADNRLALVGGRNVGDEYFGAADTNFRDTDLLLLGPAVAQASSIFDAFWNSAAVVPLQALHAEGAAVAPQELAARQRQWLADAGGSPWLRALDERRQWLEQQLQGGGKLLHWSARIEVVSDPPEKASPVASRRDRAHWLLYDLMALLFSAERESWIVSPYFVPGASGNLLLGGQARRGMDVRVLTNSLAANDVPTVHAGYAKYRAGLLRDGVQLYELRPSHDGDTQRRIAGSSGASLHSKAVLVDGRRGFVGSFNFDPRSVQLNTEMGVVFDQPGLAAELRRFFEESTAPALAWRVTLADDGQLRWSAGSSAPWQHEPETGPGLRLLTWLLGLLPIESQL